MIKNELITQLYALFDKSDELRTDDKFQEEFAKRGKIEISVIADLSVEIYKLRKQLKYKFGWIVPKERPESKNNWTI